MTAKIEGKRKRKRPRTRTYFIRRVYFTKIVYFVKKEGGFIFNRKPLWAFIWVTIWGEMLFLEYIVYCILL